MPSASGLYIHIPFCQRKCSYCDFFSVVSPKRKSDFLDALVREIGLRAVDWQHPIRTIYFGGGTPSSLTLGEVAEILRQIRQKFDLSPLFETTFEANPDDLSLEYLVGLRTLGFNRLSLGIQSLDDNELCFLNRRHDSQRAIEAVRQAREAGFLNISIDLMYGFPGQTLASWQQTLDQALALGVEHLSAYHLSFESGTPLYGQLQRGEITELSEETSILFYEILHQTTERAGLLPYEISNFSRLGFESRHNSAYWDFTPYLGFGPSAHSFDGKRRWWNVSSLNQYCSLSMEGKPFFEQEELSSEELYNDFIITTLRRIAGFSVDEYVGRFGQKRFEQFNQEILPLIEQDLITCENSRVSLTHKGLFVSDSVFVELLEV